MDILYQNPGDFHDITAGTSTGTPHYTAGPGYDYVTGLGSPMVNRVVGSLDGTVTSTPTPRRHAGRLRADHRDGRRLVQLHGHRRQGRRRRSTPATPGRSRSPAPTARPALPGSYTFTAADDGSHTFTVTLKTAGTRTITATATSGPALAGTSAGIEVSPAAASQFVSTGLSSTATAGVAESFTITAKDAYGNVATGYTGTVTISSSDPGARLPAGTTLTSGAGSFTIAFETAGSQSVTAAATGVTAATQSGISVSPAAPTVLTAAAASSSQINLSWTDSAGDTGYLVQRSANGGSSWTQVGGTLAGGTTSYQDTGLSAGTTYEYRVVATGGGLDSAYSNVATATTTGRATTDSIWSNSYTPSENDYSSGSYELGVKFTSSVAGEVTGVRFYKQTWMGGTTHVGHLWSSTGTLLATATFTNETLLRLAAGQLLQPDGDPGQHGLHRLVLQRRGLLRDQLGVLHRWRGQQRPAASAVQQHDRGRWGLQRRRQLPGSERLGDELLGGCRLLAVGQHERQDIDRRDKRAGRRGVHRRGVELRGRAVHGAAPAGPSSFPGGSHATSASAAQTAAVGLASRSYLRNMPQPGTPIQWGWKGSSLLGSIDG